jgi:hypothetical protein
MIHVGAEIKAWMNLVGNTEGQRALGNPSRRQQNYIKMYLKEPGLERLDWFDVDRSRQT